MASPNIFHTSDLHGSYHGLLTQLAQIENLDIWVDTGDFFPNKTRGTSVEKSYQMKWALDYTKIAHRIAEICMERNISVVSVSGNHDYVSLADLLKVAGMSGNNVFDLSSASHSATVHGIKFAGFREIPYIAGEWAGETETHADSDRVVCWKDLVLRKHLGLDSPLCSNTDFGEA